jgi:hypothetical protein
MGDDPGPTGAVFLVNAGRALDAAEVIPNDVPPESTASGGRGRRFKSSHSDQYSTILSVA